MPAKAVTDALGDSIDRDELKGDYAAAAAAAAAALDTARAGGEPAAHADAAIWAGLVAALRSEPAAAATYLEEALRAVPDYPLGIGLRHFAAGAGRRLPDGHSRELELSELWIEPRSGDPVEAELHALTRLPSLRTSVQTSAATRPQSLEIFLDDALGTLEQVWDRRPYAHRAAAEIAWIAGLPALAQEHLDAATAAYSAAGDVAGVAGCDLAQAAWLTVSVGSPLTFGFALSENRAMSTSEQVTGFDRTLAPVPDAADSAPAYQRAEAGFRAAGAPRGIAMVDLHRAAVAALHDDPATALEAAERARSAFEQAGDVAAAHLAAAHAALAGIHAGALPERGDVAAQIGAWGRASGSFGWALGIGRMFSLVGWRWLRRDADPDRALACHRLADATFTALGATDFAHQILGDRARAHDATGNWEAAIVAVGAAWRMLPELQAQRPEWSEELGLREGDLVTLVRLLAHPARAADLLEGLRPALERTRARYEEIARGEGPAASLPVDMRESMMKAYAELARATTSDIEFDAIRVQLYRALAVRAKNPREFARLRGLALDAAAATPADGRGRVEASLLLSFGDRPAAAKAFRDHPPPEPVPPDAGEIAADSILLIGLEDWPEARRHHETLEQLAGRPDWWAQESRPWRLVRDLARTAEGLGELERAGELYDTALELLEAQRARLTRDRGRFGDVQPEATLYGDAARAALAGGTGPEPAAAALALAERGRARGLLARMAGSAAGAPASPGQAADLREWRTLTGRIEVLTSLAALREAEPPPELAATEAALAALEEKLAAENPRWLEAVAPRVATLGADEVRDALPEGSVLIEHLLVRGALLAWAVTPDGPVTARLTPTDDAAADELQRKFWTACQGRSPLWERFARQLGDLLLTPFDDAIAAADHVILVPHRWGHLAPLQALHWRGAPLIEAKTVSVLPSASALHFLPRSAPPGGGPLLAVGDPTNMSRRRPGEDTATGGFGALPWSGAQAAEAAGWFAGSPPPLLGAAAREQAVRDGLAGARVVHFATHGILDEAPMLACVVLAEGDTLEVWELLGLPLDADLVVFSSCDSAGTPVTPGDEVVGLAWLTLAAGARAVVASLWKVAELSTALLMRAFYGALRDGRTPHAALAQAQRHLKGLTRATAAPEIAALRAAAVAAGRSDPGEPDDVPADFSHPFHWAGFVLIGA